MVPGFALALFQLVTSPAADPHLCQAGGILLKHLSKTRWAKPPEPNEPVVFPPEVKQGIKDNLLAAICSVPKPIRIQLGLVLTDIMIADFPHNWPTLVPQCLQLINSQNPVSIDGALYALRMASKRYEWCTSQNDRRGELHQLVEMTFPTLCELLKYLISLETMESLNMQLLICKIFWSSTQFGMPPYLCSVDRFSPWLQLFLQMLERPIPAGDPEDADERDQWLPWKVKKWVSVLFDRLFQRFGTERNTDAEHNKEFSKMFMNVYVIKLLESVLNVLNGPMARIIPRKLRTALLNYLNNSVYHAKTWKMVKPHLDGLFASVLFPILVWGSADLELFKDDPHEYIRKQFDYVAEYSDPRAAILQFMLDVVQLRGNEHLVTFMSFAVHKILTPYLATPPEQRNYALKDAALLVVGNLAPLLKKSPTFKDSLEEMMHLHVMPELVSPIGFMRSRACWIFGQFYNIQYKNVDSFLNAVQIVVNSVNDKELPVRVYSALSLHFLVKAKTVKPKIESILPQLLEAFMSLMGEIDNDDLVAALQSLIKKYSKQVSHLAPAIASKLIEQYGKLISRGTELFDDDDQTGMLTAMQLLKAIETLLESTQGNQEIYIRMQPILKGLLMTINPTLVDVFQDYIQILAMYTFYVDKISIDMWEVFLKFVDCFNDWASDFASELLIPFDNFISRDTETFLSNPIFLQKICEMYQKVVADPNSPETDAGSLCTLMEVVIVYCTGRVDHIIPQVLQIAVERLSTAQLPPFKVLLLEVFANSLLYNPLLTLNYVESQGWTAKLFGLWFQMLNEHFTRLHDIKLTILSMSSLLSVPFAQLPNSLKGELKNLVCTIMELIFKFTELEKKKKAAEQNDDDEDEEDEGGDEGEGDDDDDDDDEDGDVNLGDSDNDEKGDGKAADEGEHILNKIKGIKGKEFGDEEDVFGDDHIDMTDKLFDAYLDDDDDEFNLEDEDDFEVKTDQMDEVIYFCEAFSAFSKRDTQVYLALVNVFSDADKVRLTQLAEEANKRSLAKQQEQQKKQ